MLKNQHMLRSRFSWDIPPCSLERPAEKPSKGLLRDIRTSAGLGDAMKTSRTCRRQEILSPHARACQLGGREGADPKVLARALLAALNKLLPSDHDPTHEGGWTALTLTVPTVRPRDAD